MKTLKRPLKMTALLAVSSVFACLAVPQESHGQLFTKWKARKEASAGEAAARKDISQGIVRYEIGGIPSPTDAELSRLAKEKYQITVAFSGCVIGPRVDFDRAYRQTVIDHLKAKHGFDPVMKIESELRAKRK